jgi:Ankyrin repeats (3 copies)
MSALSTRVERGDLALARPLVERGAAFLDLLYQPGFERLVIHKLDFEDAAGLRWFLGRGVDVNDDCCLHHAIARGRGLTIIRMLLDAGADVKLPSTRCDAGRRPLALAARCGHLAAHDLLASRGATATSIRSTSRCSPSPAANRCAYPRRCRRQRAIRPATTTAGSSASSRCWGEPT